jgi:hypothetical protein
VEFGGIENSLGFLEFPRRKQKQDEMKSKQFVVAILGSYKV